jgi:hypothetical protein
MHREPFLQMDSCSASGLFIPQFFFLYFSSSSCNTTKVKPGVIRTQQREKEPKVEMEKEKKNVLKTLGSLSRVLCDGTHRSQRTLGHSPTVSIFHNTKQIPINIPPRYLSRGSSLKEWIKNKN